MRKTHGRKIREFIYKRKDKKVILFKRAKEATYFGSLLNEMKAYASL